MARIMTVERAQQTLIDTEHRQAASYRATLAKMERQGITDPIILEPLRAALNGCLARLANLQD